MELFNLLPRPIIRLIAENLEPVDIYHWRIGNKRLYFALAGLYYVKNEIGLIKTPLPQLYIRGYVDVHISIPNTSYPINEKHEYSHTMQNKCGFVSTCFGPSDEWYIKDRTGDVYSRVRFLNSLQLKECKKLVYDYFAKGQKEREEYEHYETSSDENRSYDGPIIPKGHGLGNDPDEEWYEDKDDF